MSQLEKLKDKIFETSDDDCFIERDRFLALQVTEGSDSDDYYATLLAGMLDFVSTPVDEHDIFVGRVVEGKPIPGIPSPNGLLCSTGHMNPNYEKLITLGYRGILEEIEQYAEALGTDSAKSYARNARIVIEAIRTFALRYAKAATTAGNERAGEALRHVPYEPAYDLYSALQGIWLVHMIASCYVGSRDYAFGYMDEYLYPLYLKEKERGTSDDEIREMLAGFILKTNEICGRTTHNYKTKPILSVASKQYLSLDGGHANELSELFLDAAKINNLAQPEITVMLSRASSDSFKQKVADTMAYVTDKLQVYHYELLCDFLCQKSLPEDIVSHPCYSACCTFDLYHHTVREEGYLPTVNCFSDLLMSQEFASMEDLKHAYAQKITQITEEYLNCSRPICDIPSKYFVLDCLLIGDCNRRCDYPPAGLKYRLKNIFLPGIATLGNSLYVLDQFVFSGNRMTYTEFTDMLRHDFVGYEAIHRDILALPKFGNDTEADRYTVDMGELLIQAVNEATHEPNEILSPAFYSLTHENNGWSIPATPDGRRAGERFSENQSPTYGTDTNGITALLNSVSKLPFEKAIAGGLNLTFSSKVSGDILLALITSYFEKKGLHVGITVLDKDTLRDAIEHPEQYQTLTVRLYGFSEYFINLPDWQQTAVLNRTAY